MAYAGICGGDDLQPHSDPFFHCESLDEIVTYTTAGAGSIPTPMPTGNSPPSVDAGSDVAIPRETPFTLTARGNDPDGDPLTFCWEERDLGPQSLVTNPDDGRVPLFRSFAPTRDPARIFPRLADLLAGTTTVGERLPDRDRTMTFRVTARDNRGTGGGVAGDEVQFRVVSTAGPFRVNAPNALATLSGRITVTWSVAQTNLPPISVAQVNIKLSTDGGLTFPTTLALATPNDGSQEVTLPSLPTTTARIKVEAVANVFFDISDVNFVIESGLPPTGPLARPGDDAKGDNQLEPAAAQDLRPAMAPVTPADQAARTAQGDSGRNALERRLEAIEEELKQIRRFLEERRP
jgi:hypothetical protein